MLSRSVLPGNRKTCPPQVCQFSFREHPGGAYVQRQPRGASGEGPRHVGWVFAEVDREVVDDAFGVRLVAPSFARDFGQGEDAAISMGRLLTRSADTGDNTCQLTFHIHAVLMTNRPMHVGLVAAVLRQVLRKRAAGG